MGRPPRQVRLPDDIDSCAALAGDLLATADRITAVAGAGPAERALARDAALLGRALAEYTECMRWLRDENASTCETPGFTQDHRTATEMGKARARLRQAALTVRRPAGSVVSLA